MAEKLPYPIPDPGTDQWDPFALLRNLQFLAEKIEALLPTGSIILVGAGSTCPSGFTKVSTDNGAYVRISTGSAGGTGGSLNATDAGHTHGAGSYAVSTHTHAVGRIVVELGGLTGDTGVAVGRGESVAAAGAGGHTHANLSGSTAST